MTLPCESKLCIVMRNHTSKVTGIHCSMCSFVASNMPFMHEKRNIVVCNSYELVPACPYQSTPMIISRPPWSVPESVLAIPVNSLRHHVRNYEGHFSQYSHKVPEDPTLVNPSGHADSMSLCSYANT